MTIIPSTNIGLQTPTVTDPNLVGNLNTQAIINAEMQQYEQPILNLQNQQKTLNGNISDYQQINTDLTSLQTAANALSTSSDWQQMQATSSDSTVASATATQGTPAGSIQFVVQQLAAADTLVSAGSVSSTSDVVTSSPDLLLSQGGSQIGFSSLASSGLTLGQHTIKVTQASQAAQTVGSTDLSTSVSSSAPVTIGSTNDTITASVNGGTAQTFTIASGTYSSAASLAAAVNSAVSGAGLSAGINANGQLVLATANQGSTQSLQVTGGTALASLGLSTMASAATGVDGIVSVDGGAAQDVGTVSAGQALTLTASTGAIDATVVSAPPVAGGSLLQVGSLTATDVSTGNGSLADVVNNINAAGTGITASSVQTGTDSYVLQLTSSKTGSSNDLSVGTSAFTSAFGGWNVVQAGTDAKITVGSGANPYSLTSATDTFTGLLPGLSVTAEQTSTTPVTITVSPDGQTLANNVQSLVSAANTVLGDIQQYAGYDATTKQGGPLMGSAILQDLKNQIQGIVASTTGTSTLGNAESVGITLSKDGTLKFDQATFLSAFSANPTQVANMFTEGGTFAPTNTAYTGQVTVGSAQTATQSGIYDVTISQSAQQAVDTGSTFTVPSGGGSPTVSTPETLTIAMGGTSVDYTTTTGESLASIASGLNAALAKGDLAMSAQVVNVTGGQALQLESADYGTGASFTVSSTATGSGTTGLAGTSGSTTFSGVNVAGTIDGIAATGIGQSLSLPTTASSPAAGLSLDVTTTGITSSTDLGSLTYSPGIAQSLADVADGLSNATSGSITTTIKNLQNQALGLNPQIQMYQNIAAEEQKMLTDRYSQLQVTLGQLQNQSSSLASALSGIPGI